MSPVDNVLDYGCGKLRYSSQLVKRCKRLTLVDSGVQLDRLQTISGRQTTVRHFAGKRWATCRVLTIEEFQKERLTYDFILCSNVLSAIPVKSVRSKVLYSLHKALDPSGSCLFVTQYRNSDFRKMAASKLSSKHLDGWILNTSRGAFYYGLLNRADLERLVTQHGFRISKSWVEGESAYVLAANGKSSIRTN
jgi:2-polyprenyl-3-methyl-5-hydroxy-6-metoxy-1,4-benzoquinol methylase